MFKQPTARIRELGGRAIQHLESLPPFALVMDMIRHFGSHQVGDMAASVAYYGLFAIFPLFLGIIAIASFALDPVEVEEELLKLAALYLPGAEDVIKENIEQVFRVRGAIGIVAIVGLVWSASVLFGALTRVLDRAWGVAQTHAFHVAKLRSLIMVVSVAGLFILSLSSSTILQTADRLAVVDPFGLGGFLASGARVVLQGSSLFGSIAMPMLLYRFAPSQHMPWRDVAPAALFAGIMFEIAKNAFLFYLSQFAQFDKVYGSLSLVVVLLLWLYISSMILIIGAEFGAALGRWHRGETRRAFEARALGQG
ncbi:MAG: YihY/virulence factor BrkB family protein [Chloroflexi bacterium]|nr:YihY/virulence factor BrkB family protein [Chloroflexota bacterium]